MYRSVLEETGLHREVEGKWRFMPPEGTMRHAWNAIEAFLEETERQRKTITELYELLKRPPFGIKAGLLPVLVCTALLCREAEVALYEQGSLVPELSAPVVERLLRWPERFEMRQVRIAGVRLEVFERLTRALLSGGKSEKTLLDVVRGLVRFFATLPQFTKNTACLRTEVLRVRDALVRAREPGQLLFADLPAACGCEPFDSGPLRDEGHIEQFVGTLRQSLAALQDAYPQLLSSLELGIAEAFGVSGRGATLRKSLRDRARRVLPFTVEPALRAFLVRASDEGLDQDEWLVSLATHLTSKPPAVWIDRDRDQFGVELALVVRRFRSIEAIAVSDTGDGENSAEFVRVAVTRKGSTEHEAVVVVSNEEIQFVEQLRARIMAAVDAVPADISRNNLIAALALATEDLLVNEGAVLMGLGQTDQ
jgi:hypothetical protein